MQNKYDIYDIPKNINPKEEKEIDEMVHHLLGLCMNEIDFKAAKKLCELYFKSEILDIKHISILCVGHISRVYKKLVDNSMINEIKKIAEDPDSDFYSVSNDALDDIEHYVDKNIRSNGRQKVKLLLQ